VGRARHGVVPSSRAIPLDSTRLDRRDDRRPLRLQSHASRR
jgi:hypothetical protein